MSIRELPEIVKRIYNLVLDLREEGINIPIDSVENIVDIITTKKIYNLDTFKATLKTYLIKDVDNFPIFEILFEKNFPEFFYEGKFVSKKIIEKKKRNILDTIKEEEKELKKLLIRRHNLAEAIERMRRHTIGGAESPLVKKLKKKLEMMDKEINSIKNTIDIYIDSISDLDKEKEMLDNINRIIDTARKEYEEYIRGKESERDELESIENAKREAEKSAKLYKRTIESKYKESDKAIIGRKKAEISRKISKKGIDELVQKSLDDIFGIEDMITLDNIKRGKVKFSPKKVPEKGIDKDTGIPRLPDAKTSNNEVMKYLLDTSIDNIEDDKLLLIIKNLLDNNLFYIKRHQLADLYQKEILENDRFVNKLLMDIENFIRDALLNSDFDINTKKQIYAEILSRTSELKKYNYKKEAFRKLYIRRKQLSYVDIRTINFKDLQQILESNADLYDVIIDNMKKEVIRLAKAFMLKKSKKYEIYKKGKINVKKTVSYNFKKYGDKIVDLVYSRRKPRKSNLFILCDISYSVNHASYLFLLFLDACSKAFNKLITYVFVDDIIRITNFEEYKEALKKIGSRNSNMRVAFYQLSKLNIPKDFVLIILTDCRTNNYDYIDKFIYDNKELPYSYEILRSIRERVSKVIILDPESRDMWNKGLDGPSAYKYINYSKVPVFEFYNLKTLKHTIDYLERHII